MRTFENWDVEMTNGDRWRQSIIRFPRDRICAVLEEAFSTRWPSYALIVLLQTKILWNIWRLRDLTTGDTSAYFVQGYRWYERLANDIVWSPLYTAFYGSALVLTQDAYSATILHRVIIVLAAAIGVLAV